MHLSNIHYDEEYVTTNYEDQPAVKTTIDGETESSDKKVVYKDIHMNMTDFQR